MYYTRGLGFVKYKQPNMPLYGIAHGNNQAAFIGYASSGGEYMEIIVIPDEVERTHYNGHIHVFFIVLNISKYKIEQVQDMKNLR